MHHDQRPGISVAALALALGFLPACSGAREDLEEFEIDEGAWSTEGSLPTSLPEDARQAIESRITELGSGAWDKAALPSCPATSLDDLPLPGTHEHFVSAMCSENGNIYFAYLSDTTFDGTTFPTGNQRGPFTVYVGAAPRGQARAYVSNDGADGACLLPIDGTLPATEKELDYGQCRALRGIRVEAIR